MREELVLYTLKGKWKWCRPSASKRSASSQQKTIMKTVYRNRKHN